MTVRAIPLLSGYSTANMSSPYIGPEMPRNLQDALVLVTVESVTGTPTTATISPKLQLWHSHVGANQEEVIFGGTGASPVDTWFDLSSATNPSLLPDGDWPVALDVNAAVLATPIAVFRAIRGGFPWRLNLAWAFTGGTTPSMKISAMAYCRESSFGGFDRVESSA